MSLVEGFTFLLGGARSGKSDLAQRLIASVGSRVSVVVTAEAGDAEMVDRISRHQLSRPKSWATLEAPRSLGATISGVPSDHALLVDCISFWVANRVMDGDPSEAIESEAGNIARHLAARLSPVVVVGNEVGQGLVPADEVSRRFRDVNGRVNRILADTADKSLLVVAGRLLPLQPAEDIFGPLP